MLECALSCEVSKSHKARLSKSKAAEAKTQTQTPGSSQQRRNGKAPPKKGRAAHESRGSFQGRSSSDGRNTYRGRIVEAEFAAAAATQQQLPPAMGIEIAFAGRSNVGKSSLMNALCGRKNLVRTSSTPGCTRQIAFFNVRTADDARITLVDLPGYGYAKRSKSERGQWAELIEGYLLSRPTLNAVVCLVDIRRGLQADDAELLTMLTGPANVTRPALSILSVATKLDKLPRSQHLNALAALKKQTSAEALGVSVNLPETQTKLWQRLRELCGIPLASIEPENETTSQAEEDTADPEGVS